MGTFLFLFYTFILKKARSYGKKKIDISPIP